MAEVEYPDWANILGFGSYSASEADLGEKTRPFAGFGRNLDEPSEPEEEIWPGVVFTPVAFQTSPGAVVYEMSSWRAS